MPRIKKILFPVDFSPSSMGAARYVEWFAGWSQAEVKLLHVIDTGTYFYPQEAAPFVRKHLDEFLTSELKYFAIQRECVLGDPASKIAEVAGDWKPDLIMMATRGLGMYRRFLLGSVAAKVLDDTQCPVWTSVHAERAPVLENISCAKILCALDLGERSREVLEWAATLAGEHNAALGIVHATPVIAAGRERLMDQDFAEALASDARGKIAALQTSAGTNASVSIIGGEPSDVSARAVTEFHADFLVIGRHNGTGIAGHLRHNAYSILRDSPCPVISL